jgi:Asp-tRNA(Asn)/Glu-tRNA(Gln) amidotransferase A subunit family amidase
VAPGLVNLSATALARAIRNREISPIEVVEGQLDRIKARNDGNNGSITGMPEAARAAAREADAA